VKIKPGKLTVKLGARIQRAHSQPECLAIVWEHCAKVNPALIEYLANLKRKKVRLIAKSPRELNPDRQDLTEKCTRVFGEYWLYNTRSGDKVVKLMDLACRFSGLRFQTDVVVDTSMFNCANYVPVDAIDVESLL
jgi:hypothetical protein